MRVDFACLYIKNENLKNYEVISKMYKLKDTFRCKTNWLSVSLKWTKIVELKFGRIDFH